MDEYIRKELSMIQDDYIKRKELMEQLNDCIAFKKETGRRLARAEAEYKQARTLLMAKMMIVGYECEDGTTKPIAATAVYNLAQGDPEIAKLKLARDLRQSDLDVTQEKIYQVKLHLNIIENDLKRDVKGV